MQPSNKELYIILYICCTSYHNVSFFYKIYINLHWQNYFIGSFIFFFLWQSPSVHGYVLMELFREFSQPVRIYFSLAVLPYALHCSELNDLCNFSLNSIGEILYIAILRTLVVFGSIYLISYHVIYLILMLSHFSMYLVSNVQ